MAKINTLFMTKMANNPCTLEPHIPIYSIFTSNNQRLGSAFDAFIVIQWRISLADFHLLSIAKVNIFLKQKSDHDVLQAYITKSQNEWQCFPAVFCLSSRSPFYVDLCILKTMICRHIAWQRQFPGTIKTLIKVFTFAFKFRDKYSYIYWQCLTVKRNLEKYIFYMHHSVYYKLLAGRILANICNRLLN